MSQIKLSVDYYNNLEETKFKGFPNYSAINNLVQNGVTIPKDEFLAYMIFIDQYDADGFRTYIELSKRISFKLGDIDDYLSFNNSSIQSKVSSKRLFNSKITERIGVSLGLCVVNNIHGFTKADWKKIDDTQGPKAHPTFDFEYSVASTGINYIQVEDKGSVVIDNYDSKLVAHHYSGKHGILKKKHYIRKINLEKNMPVHQHLFYGTISVLDQRAVSLAKVWLVDPPAFEINMDPRKYKLLARLYYYLDEFKKIGVKEGITKVLEERIKLIKESKDYNNFDNKPIVIKPLKREPDKHYMDGQVLAEVETNEAFGRFFVVEKDRKLIPFLIAYPKSLMRSIVNQNFKSILNYSYNPDFMNESVHVHLKFSSKDREQYKMLNSLNFIFNGKKGIYEKVYYGKVSHSSDGRIFGLLEDEKPFESNSKNIIY